MNTEPTSRSILDLENELSHINSELYKLYNLQQIGPLDPVDLVYMTHLNSEKLRVSNAIRQVQKTESVRLWENMTLAEKVEQVRKDMADGVIVRKEDLTALVFDLYECNTKTLMKLTDDVTDAFKTKSEGIKHDTMKPDFSLLSPLAITYLVSVLDKGKIEYDAHNWRKGIDQTRLISAAMRHLFAFLGGQDNDPETGLPHMAHVMCCAMFSLELQVSANDKDTRYNLSREQLDLLESMLAGVLPE